MKIIGFGALAGMIMIGSFLFSGKTSVEYKSESVAEVNGGAEATAESDRSESVKADLDLIHLETPEHVKAIYMTSWVAGTPYWRDDLVSLIEGSDLNAVVIDIKDDTGKISFEVRDPDLKKVGSYEKRIADIDSLIKELHQKNIYVIGRVSVFQDPYLVSKRPELAVKRESDKGVWKDRKGLTWLDAGSKEVWEYATSIAREAHSRGFDEINFDYIRFPSDGNLEDIFYPVSEDKKRVEVIESFFKYLSDEIGDEMPISADLFGLVTIAEDDLGIGQELLRALPYFDYISPMVYPSHFAPGTFGYGNPASFPYEIINESMRVAVLRAIATSTPKIVTVGTTTKTSFEPRESFPKEKLRPWIQDFDLGAEYGKLEVEAQIRALKDLGLHSFMIWDPSNKYSRGVDFGL